MVLGSMLRSARRQAGLTQVQLARELGMSQATISALEKGTIQELGIRKVARVCDRLGLELNVAARGVTLPSLDQAYELNRRDRREALRQADAGLSDVKGDSHA